jgi:dTDP-4-dehydrorhamnose reductase
MTKIVVTGGTGRFATVLKKHKTKHELFYPTKSELDILDYKKIISYLKKFRPKILIHLAGLSRPMNIHQTDINKSIDLNIIGTSNITKACSDLKIKLIYFSTNYVYPGLKGNYTEVDPVKPFNNYAWSKLGGEAAVHLYKNSLILRVSMTEEPFIHKKAFKNVISNFLYHGEVVKILFKLLRKKGIINIGGKKRSIYDFAKEQNIRVKKINMKKNTLPKNSSMNLDKLRKMIR